MTTAMISDLQTVSMTASTVEVSVVWGRGRDACVFATKQFKAGSKITFGEGCDFEMPIEKIEIDALEQNPIALGNSTFTVFMRGVEQTKELAPSKIEMLLGGAMPQLGLSALGHGLLVAAFAFFMPAMGAADEDGVSRDQLLQMKALLSASAEQDVVPPEADATKADEATSDHSGGKKAEGKEGMMGKNDITAQKNASWSAKGDAKPEDAQLANERLRREAMEFGMIGLLNAGSIGDPNTPVVPWASVYNGSDKTSHMGNLWTGDAGDVFGWGGLGLSGEGSGGGCKGLDCKGIGINDIGGLGHSLDKRIGSGTCMVGPCTGNGTAPVGGGHVVKAPSMRQPIDFQSGGKLPKDVIQREVRLHAGQMRACYEDGLRTNPSLQGRVEVKFVIGREGNITIAQDTANSDLPNPAVRACVVKQFYNLSFASPGGMVSVTYPLVFLPSEG